MSFALDDFGDGRSSLRLWSELEPEVVKIDKYFTSDLAHHAKKLKTIRALMQIAENFGSVLVAEGVENEDDLRVLRDIGIPLAQGYFLGRPDAAPRSQIEAAAAAAVVDRRVAVMPMSRVAASPMRLRQIPIIPATPVSPQSSNNDVLALFLAHTDWHALAVVADERPLAIIGRQQFLDRFAQQYFREIHGRDPCLTLANTAPVLVEFDDEIDSLIKVLTSADQRYLNEGFIYTENGLYRGLGTGHQLVRRVTESRIEAARHANPLTLLPGNIPISEHIERLLAAGSDFVACYADLNSFKPFNDYYGYWRGDEVIKLLAATISRHADPQRDFVGHVGGDDFVILFQSADWLVRCERLVAEFNAAAVQLYDADARAAGGIEAEDRRGFRQFFGFTSVYMGAVALGANSALRGAAEVATAAARAKLQAKAQGLAIHLGSGIWVAPTLQADHQAHLLRE
jgi:predicted signal transduction protein with EAL and GGDEF domain